MTRIHINAVVSTNGTPHQYLGLHLGNALLNRGLSRQVVTFETDVTDEELGFLQNISNGGIDHDRICHNLGQQLAVVVHSISVTRNIQH
jgi:hypothetical protein